MARACFAFFLIAGLSLATTLAAQDPTNNPPHRLDPNATFARFDFWDNRDFDWFAPRVPLIETPDRDLDEIYYYRWELLTKHLVYGSPNDGWASTEFIDRPFWSGTYGAISCPAGLQLFEMRWLRDPQIARDYGRYWFRVEGAQPRRYSTWLAHSLWAIHSLHPDPEGLVDLLDDLIANYQGWEHERFDPEIGLFWQIGHDDGMETNINSRQTPDWFRGAPAYRPTLNAYMWADAHAIARIAELAGRTEVAANYRDKADQLKRRMQEKLWDPKRQFFFPMSRQDEELDGFVVKKGSLTHQTGKFAGSPYGRELIGYVPWQFGMLDPGFENAWRALFDPKAFQAPYGPTTVERQDPLFLISQNCCVWSGQSWPYATSQTLQALAELLQTTDQDVVSKEQYFELLSTYVRTHRKAGRPYIAEAAHPDTGSWEGHDVPNHSEHYFHSSFCDLVLSGLFGIRATADDRLELKPLVPDSWSYFLVQDVPYHGHRLTLRWDRDGSRYGQGAGFVVLCNDEVLHHSEQVTAVDLAWPEAVVTPDPTRSGRRDANVAVNNDGAYFPRIRTSSTAEGSTAAGMIDGQCWYLSFPRNGWISEASPAETETIELDLGIVRHVERITLHPFQEGDLLQPPLGISVEAQIDGEWQQVVNAERSRSAESWARRELSFPLNAAIKASVFRITLTKKPGTQVGLSELGLWGIQSLPLEIAPIPTNNLALRVAGSEFPKPSASHTSRFDSVEMLNDGEVSFRPGPHNRWTAYESMSEEDWVMLEWQEPVRFDQVELGFYDDRGGVQPPESYRIEVRVNGQWLEAEELERTPLTPRGGEFNEIAIEPVTADALKVILRHRGASRAGLTEIFVRDRSADTR